MKLEFVDATNTMTVREGAYETTPNASLHIGPVAAAVPEPSVFGMLLGAGGLMAGGVYRRRKLPSEVCESHKSS